MRLLNIIMTLILVLTGVFSVSADSKPSKKLLIEKYEKQLKTITSARDSVRILYYLFDLSDRRTQALLAWDIYYTAGRAENVTAQLDMLRTLSTFYSGDDTIMANLMKMADEVPNDISRAATKTFILNQQITRKSRRPNDTEFQRMLLDSIKNSHDFQGDDIYDKIALLFQIIQYLGIDAEGVLFKECLDRYAELMKQLPNSDYPLKNQYYTTAAIIHSRLNGNPEKAIQCDRYLLDIMDQLQTMYKKKNRIFRNYDASKYISYRRMLSNYMALSPEEIEEIHDSVLAIAARDFDVQRSIETDGDASVFYHMAHKDYEKAIPMLKHILGRPILSAYNIQKYTAMLIEAAKESGDRETYVEAMEDFIRNSNRIDSIRRVSMRREIMLRDSILTTPLLFKDSPAAKVKYISRKSETAVIVLASILAVLLVIYAALYLKLRLKLTRNAGK